MNNSTLLTAGRNMLLAALVLFAGSALAQNVEKKDSVSTIPAEVASILKPACMTCHSNEGRDKPKAKVNFSVWEQYSPMEKKLLASSITDEVKKGSMPHRPRLTKGHVYYIN